jgi:hypothetical protein
LQPLAVEMQNAGGMAAMQPSLQVTAAHAALSRQVASHAR